jgi:flagellar hook-associated protein 2
MAITATGLGSGLDIESIVSGLMALERRPLDVLEKRQSEIESKISAFGQLKGAVSKFQSSMSSLKSISAFQVFSANSSNEDVFTATASSAAVAGTYSIEFLNSNINHQLAQAHKMNSTNFTDAATSTGAAGTMQIDVGSDSFTVDVDGSNDTLQGIRDAINNAAGNDNLVTASIIKVSDTESRLILTAEKTGVDNAITLTDNSGNVASTLAMTTKDAAQNAKFTIDGFLIERSSNVIDDVIEGVTITLNEKSDSAQTLAVAYDTESVKESMQGFIDAYNEMNTTLRSLRLGGLQGDNSVLSVESQFRSVFNTTPTGLTTSLKALSEIGIRTTKNGDLSLDSSVLDSKLASDYGGVAQLLANDSQGFVFRLESAADNLLDLDGLIATRTDSLDSQVGDIEDRKISIGYRLEQVEQRLRSQFAALDSLMSNLNATGNYLAQQLSNLPGAQQG